MIRAPHRAFTLLELLLVLVLIIGVLAIVWPAVGRSLASTDLREAAKTLRETLADARTLAINSGEPVLVRIEPDGQTFRFDRWQHAIATADRASGPDASGLDAESSNEPIDTPALSSRNTPEPQALDSRDPQAARGDTHRSDAARDSAPSPQYRQLSGDVAVVAIRATANQPVNASVDSFSTRSLGSNLDRRGSSADAVTTIDSSRNAASESNRFESANALDDVDSLDSTFPTAQAGWIWFLPHGEAPGIEIQLYDRRSQRELTVTIDSWTGAIEIGPDRRHSVERTALDDSNAEGSFESRSEPTGVRP